MRILVCFSTAADLEMLSDEDWVIENSQVDTSFVRREISCYDESAIETALKLSDQENSCRLTALSIDDKAAESYMKTLYALRFDHAVRIHTDEDLRFAPSRKASYIAGYVKQQPQDVILMGMQGSIGSSSLVPFLTAELLGVPCISRVISIQYLAPDLLEVTSSVDDGMIVQRISPPAVLTVGNAEHTSLRVPTLKDRMSFGRKPVEILKTEDLACGNPPEEAVLRSLERVEEKRTAVLIREGTPSQKAEKLYDEFLKPRMDRR